MPNQYGYDDKKLNIIMLNMSSFFDWDHGVVNRNFNILHALEKEERIGKIIGVDFLPLTIKKAAAHYLKNILWEIKTAEMVYGDLTSACYQRTDKIYAYTTIDSLFSLKKVAKELRRVEKILNLKNIVFWSYNPMFVEFIDKLNEKMFVFDTVDNWTEHPSYLKLMSPPRLAVARRREAGKKRLLKNYQTIAEKADLIFTVSDELKDFYKDFNRTKDVHWIPNGVDFAHFNNPETVNKENELSKFDKPIIGYLGTIQERVDFDLLVKIAKAHEDKEVVLCGPVWPVVKHTLKDKIKDLPNVHLLGRIKYDDAPSYVDKFSVAIIPHKVDNFIKSTNPMKMYDYLAAGKPVVSTKGAGIGMFKDHIYMANEAEQFIKYIERAIQEDSAEKQSARRDAVKKHSWLARADEMVKLMFEKL